MEKPLHQTGWPTGILFIPQQTQIPCEMHNQLLVSIAPQPTETETDKRTQRGSCSFIQSLSLSFKTKNELKRKKRVFFYFERGPNIFTCKELNVLRSFLKKMPVGFLCFTSSIDSHSVCVCVCVRKEWEQVQLGFDGSSDIGLGYGGTGPQKKFK